MQLVKIIKKTNNKIEQAKTILAIYCVLSDIKLSDTELTVLSYFMVYGINQETDSLIIKSEILSPYSLNNTKSKLKKFGLIKKSSLKKSYSITENLDLKPDAELALLIKIDNK